MLSVVSCFRVYECDLLHARVIITPYNQHVRLLSPEPLFVGCYKSKSVLLWNQGRYHSRQGRRDFACSIAKDATLDGGTRMRTVTISSYSDPRCHHYSH